jgi:hypothetical protein
MFNKNVGTLFIAPDPCGHSHEYSPPPHPGGRNQLRPYMIRWHYSIPMFFMLVLLLAACANSASNAPVRPTSVSQMSDSNGTITYSANPQDVLIRTFRGGGNFGTLEISPEVSIYGDGTYILGPGYQMNEGSLSTDALQQLLHTLVDTDSLLNLSQQQFSDTPDQNFTLLELSLNGKHYEYLYGTFGTLSESTQAMNDYHHLEAGLTAITNALNGPRHPYSSQNMVLLVHQDFSPDLTQNIPSWKFPDFTLVQAATYECGPIPQDITSPNADTGCLTYSVPEHALLLSAAQQRSILALLKGQQSGVFLEQELYYALNLRYLLPDELPNQALAMLGSTELSYTPVPLHSGAVPQITPTPS